MRGGTFVHRRGRQQCMADLVMRGGMQPQGGFSFRLLLRLRRYGSGV